MWFQSFYVFDLYSCVRRHKVILFLFLSFFFSHFSLSQVQKVTMWSYYFCWTLHNSIETIITTAPKNPTSFNTGPLRCIRSCITIWQSKVEWMANKKQTPGHVNFLTKENFLICFTIWNIDVFYIGKTYIWEIKCCIMGPNNNWVSWLGL